MQRKRTDALAARAEAQRFSRSYRLGVAVRWGYAHAVALEDIDQALAEIAERRRADPLAPVTVVVPSHVAGLQLRRRLAERGSFAAVRFETLPRLAELVAAGSLAAAERSPLARPIGDYLAGEIARAATGDLASVAALPGFAPILRGLFRRLHQGGLIGGEAIAAGRHRNLGEILHLYAAFRAESAAFYDEEDLLDAAARGIHDGSASLPTEFGEIYVAPGRPVTAASSALLDALAQTSPRFVEIAEPGFTPVSRFMFSPDPASEAREVAREVLRALDSGVALHEIGVFHGADPGYRKLVQEALTAAAIPSVALPGTPLSETATGRAALALARLPGLDFSRTATMDFIALAPLRRSIPGATGTIEVNERAWDRLSREAGITHGRGRWDTALAALAADRTEQIASLDVAEHESRRGALTLECEIAVGLRDAVGALGARLGALDRPQPATNFIAGFKRVIEQYFEPGAQWLPEVIREVDQLGTVGAVGGQFGLEAFVRALAANLDIAAVREVPFGSGVLVADYRMAGGLRFKHVVLCGSYEGVMPAGPGTNALLDDEAWRALRARFPAIEDAGARAARQREHVHRAIAAARDGTLVWSAPLYDPAGAREYHPALPMVEDASRIFGTKLTSDGLRRMPPVVGKLARGSSPLALALAGPPLDPFELGLRRAVLHRRQGGAVDTDHPRWPAIAMLRARRSSSFTEWDGNLGSFEDPSWLNLQSAVSPTSLEAYGACGFRYFCASLLRLRVTEEPEERAMMEAAARGSLVHQTLERFFKKQATAGRPAPLEPWTEQDRTELLGIADEELAAAAQRGLTGLETFLAHEARTIRADLAAFLDADTGFRVETGAVPVAFEPRFRDLDVAGVTMRGAADRIDRAPDGTEEWVIDYKTGSAAPYAEIGAGDPLASGTRLQLPAYLRAFATAKRAHAVYWFITGKEDFARISYEPTPENDARFESTLNSIVAGIRAGAFPAVAGEEDAWRGGFTNCRYCDFDRICPRRRDDDFARKEADLAMRPWRRVAEAATGQAES